MNKGFVMQKKLNIYDLSSYQLYQLKSVDPNLSYNWNEHLSEIFHVLDDESQQSVIEKIFRPRGILYDKITQKFFSTPHTPLAEILSREIINNTKLWQSAKYLEQLLKEGDEPIEIVALADELEAGLQRLAKIEVDEKSNEPQLRKKIQTAFLYDFASWLDKKELIFSEGKRKLTQDMIKSYIKEVFIKQQIQGWDFRTWDGEDIDLIGVAHFPVELKQMVKERKLHVVENSKYWFLIGPADKIGQNPYSIRRFLHEDVGRLSLFLTHVIVPRKLFEKEEIKKFLLDRISRIYTLDRSISEEVLHFVANAKKHNIEQLQVLLRRPLSHDGRESELIIAERMVSYEKTLISLIVGNIMRILEIAVKSNDDMDYLFYHVDKLFKDLQNDIEDFQLQPLVQDSYSAQQMAICLMSFCLLWTKIKNIISDIFLNKNLSKISAPIDELADLLKETEEAIIQVEETRLEIDAYEQKIAKGGFFTKLGLIKKPDYTLEELESVEKEIKQTLFMDIIRLMKKHSELVVYAEFETGQIFNEKYRHYAVLDNKKMFGMLPRLIVLPEDRTTFEPISIRQALERNVFKMKDINDHSY